MIAPPIRGEATAENLHRRIEPRSWSQLGGPMRWYEFTEQQVFEHDEHGLVVYVNPVSRVGELIKHFSEHGRFPRQSYIFAGPKGIGKTSLIRLMTVTQIAEEHEPVSYGDGDDEITMLDAETEKPFRCDPVVDDVRNFDMVRRKMRSDTEGQITTQMVEAYGCGQLSKSEIDKIAGSVNQPLMMVGGARVVILNEIDQLGTRQTPSLKSKLDPSGGLPGGFLLLADTNHISDVKSSMDSAGMDRFDVLQFSRWQKDALRQYASKYVTVLGIDFDRRSFQDDAQEEGVTELITRSDGSIRALISAVQRLANKSGRVTKDQVAQAFTDVSTGGSGRDNAMIRFRNQVVPGRQNVATFCLDCAKRSTDPTGFANKLGRFLMKNHPNAIRESLGPAMRDLFDVMQTPEGRPATESRWAAACEPLNRIAEIIR